MIFSFKARKGLQRKICADKTPRSVSHRGVLVNLGLSKKLAKFLKSLHIWLLVFQRYLVATKTVLLLAVLVNTALLFREYLRENEYISKTITYILFIRVDSIHEKCQQISWHCFFNKVFKGVIHLTQSKTNCWPGNVYVQGLLIKKQQKI